jgi:hypothetical protein
MKRDTVPARPLAGARWSIGTETRRNIVSQKGRMQNLSAGTPCIEAVPGQRCQAAKAAMQQGHVQQFKALNQIYHTLRDLMLVSCMDDG